jgi:PAS domain S-box-containing protein
VNKVVKILVIEDDEIDRLAFKRAVKMYHIQTDVTIAKSYQEARHEIETNEFDIIFTDYYLDEATAKDIIAISGSTPVLVATGTNDLQIAVDILKEGAYDFLVKDIDRSYLRVLPYTIEKVLEKRDAIEDQRILSSVVTNIRDSIVIVDSNNKILFVNPSFCDTYGYSDTEIKGIPVSILLPDDERSKVNFDLSSKYIDILHQKKNGARFYVSMTISSMGMTSDEKSDSKIIVIRDISERMNMLDQIRSSQQQLRTIFDNSAVGIGMFHPDGQLIQFNSMLLDFTGYSATELNGKNLANISHPDDINIDRDNYIKLLKGEIESYTAERRLLKKNGDIVWTRLNISQVREESSNRALYTIVIFEDITEKKRIEKALKDSEVRVEGIVTSLKDVVYSVDPKTLVINYINKAVEDVFEIKMDDFKKDNKRWQKMIHGGDLNKLLQAQDQIVREGKVETEYRIISPNGTIKWVRDRSWLVYNEDGDIERIDGIITDISKRKLAEQAFRDSEERYRTAVQSSIEAIYMLNPMTHQVIEANQAFCNLLGYSHNESLELLITDFVKGTESDIDKLIQNILDTGGGQLGERNWIKKDGSEITVQVNASRIRQRDQETLFVVARDVTNEKRIRESLEIERQLLNEVVRNAPIPMALLDEDLRFMVYSRTWIQSYGPSKIAIDGKKLFETYKLLPPEWEDLCLRGVNGEVLSIPEEEVYLPNGEKVYLRLAIHPWGDTSAQHGIVLTAERIDELVSARKQAEDANFAKSAFLARITHELRTPLNAILGYSQIMSKDNTLQDTHKSYVGSMYRSGMHLLNMINDILDLSKIEASRMEVVTAPLNLSELMQDLQEMFRLKCENKSISLTIKLDPEVSLNVISDRGKLNQILINLIGNAVKFTNSGGVNVFAGLASPAKNGLQKVKFSISDSGIGIPPEDVEKVFEAFHQSKNSNQQGTGLGLSITHKLVHLLKGEISVQSELNVGTTFEVTLPLEISHETVQETKDVYNNVVRIVQPIPFTVLVADDVEHNRQVVRLLLERIGAKVIEAENGQEAVELYSSESPDFIIMDIIMPVMDGVKAMANIRELDKSKKVPIIALTASGFDDKRDQLLKAGFDDYVLKPFTESVLLKSIADHSSVEYEITESISTVTNETEEVSVMEAISTWEHLQNEYKTSLIDHIEVQEIDEIIEFANSTEISGNHPKLARFLLDACQTFDFFKLNQLFKAIHPSKEN